MSLIHEFDLIDLDNIELVMKGIAGYVMLLSLYFTQLKHWYWAAVKPKVYNILWKTPSGLLL
jgi:hypothetical protein